MAKSLKLYVGTGVEGLRPVGYTTIDIEPDNRPDIVANADSLPMVDSSSADEFYASHVLEHFPWPQTLLVLEEWARTLKVGGTIKIAVPDMEMHATLIASGVNAFNVMGEIYGGHFAGPHQGHAFGFTRRMLAELLLVMGFDSFDVWLSDLPEAANGWLYTDNADRLGVSINLSAVKRSPPLVDIGRLAVAMRERIRDPLLTVVRDLAIETLDLPDLKNINATLYQRLNFKFIEIKAERDRLSALLRRQDETCGEARD